MSISRLVFSLFIILPSHLIASDSIELPFERPQVPGVKLSAELNELEENGELVPDTGLELVLTRDRPGMPAKFALLSKTSNACTDEAANECQEKEKLLYVLTQHVPTACGSRVYFGRAVAEGTKPGQSAIVLVDHTVRKCDDYVAPQWKIKLIEDTEVRRLVGSPSG